MKCLSVVAMVVLSGCASMTPTHQTESAFVIFDVKPGTLERGKVMDNVANAVKKHASNARITRDIPPAVLPDTPGRFELVEPFAKSKVGALMSAQGQTMKVPVCKDSVLTMNTADNSMAQRGEKTSFFLCVMPYMTGYSVNIYATYTKASGGLSPTALGASLAQSVLGDSSQFIPRAMNDVRTALEGIGGQVTTVDEYVPESFQGAFVKK